MSATIKQVHLRNFLSFGPESEPFEAQALNVFIGPNGAGKSNLIESLALLSSTPTDFARAIRAGGGVAAWLHDGGAKSPAARVEVVLDKPDHQQRIPLRYAIEFEEAAQRVSLVDEVLENFDATRGDTDDLFFYRYQEGSPALNVVSAEENGKTFRRQLNREELSPEQSVLAQRRDPESVARAHVGR